MPRVTKEFECSECRKIFDIKLNTSISGPRWIHCPNCSHIHFRNVVEGQITNSRCNDSVITEDIWAMKSSCRDFRKETKSDSEYSNSSWNDLKDKKKAQQAAQGFLRRLWLQST